MQDDGPAQDGSVTTATRAAVEHARSALAVDPGEPVRAWRVERTHPGAHAYVLVIFGGPERASTLAVVDVASNDVLESARLSPPAPHALIGARDAIARAGIGDDAKARLVWDPSSATRSRFYPLWELEHPGRTVWVDAITGRIWDTLGKERGG
jgi:hypothetical protein